jgi:hypothetical protein
VPEPASSLPPALERLRAWTEAHPRATAAACYGALAAGLAVAAYVTMFSIFNGYDDEGTLLVSVQAFAEGKTLYSDIYSPYGPFYYELFGGFFALTGWDITTEASRTIVIVAWLLTAFLFGLTTQRLTGRLLLGLAGMLVAFNILDVVVLEPMHPHGLSALLLAAFILLAASFTSRWLLASGAGAGALLAALVMTKVNLGAYAVAAVVLAAVLTVEPLHRRAWLRWLAIAAFLAMPLAIASRDLSQEWARSLIASEILAGGAVIAAAWPSRPRRDEDDDGLIDWLIVAATAFIAVLGAILLAVLLTGPSFGDVYDGTVRLAMRVRDTLSIPFNSSPAAVDWGIAALAAAVLVSWLRPTSAGRPALWPGLLRIAAGLAIWFTTSQTSPVAFGPAPGNPDALALALAWVAAVPPAGAAEAPRKRFLRVLLPALAVAETLQVYPVAGAQVVIAALIYVPVGALCIADGLAALRAWSAAGGAVPLQRFGIVATVAIVALAAKFGMDVARTATRTAISYDEQQSLPFPGAGRMRLPAEQATEYEAMVGLLRDNRCSAFIAYPNVNSLYLWSGIEPPVLTPPGAWITTLDAAEERRVVAQLRASPRPCAIRNETQAGMWLSGRPRPELPLDNYIFNRFEPVRQVGQFEFLLPRN